MLEKSPSQKLLLCYVKTAITAGRYLEDALRSLGIEVDVYTKEIDFAKIDLSLYQAVIFPETTALVGVKNIELVQIPKYFWLLHGTNRLQRALKLCEEYKIDYLLMAQSMELAKQFPIPSIFFPFAVDSNFFNCSKPLASRDYAVGFIGTHGWGYESRDNDLAAITARFGDAHLLSLYSSHLTGPRIAELYNECKIVYNQSPAHFAHFNMRLLEGMGCGALVLSNNNADQNLVFTPNEHYVLFNDQADMLEKVDYYLTHLDEAQKIASQGRDHLLAHHTYRHRAEELLAHIQFVS